MREKKALLLPLFLLLPATTSINVVAQTNMPKVRLERIVKDKPLTDILKEIEERFGTKVVFSYEDLHDIKVNASINAANVSTAINQAIAGLPVTCNVTGNYITVRLKPIPASKIIFAGRVVDNNGEPVTGAVVRLVNSAEGAITDVNGHFQMFVNKGKNADLSISYIGMEPLKYFINGKRNIKNALIRLENNSQNLDEVVVTGYQTISKERATGAFGTVTSKQLDSKLNSDLKNIIEGQVAGVVLDKDGVISIRGISTLSAETTPLLVVDGYPTEMSLSDLNPDNIENITVLKDGVAASIYGSRSANGVIVVTTKSGKKGKATLSYRGTFKFEPKPDLSYLHMASTSDFIDGELATYEEDASGYDITKMSNNQSEVEYLLTQRKAGLITNEAFDERISQLRKNNALEQIQKYMFRTAFTQMHNVSLSGGSDDITYNLAINYTSNRSSFINTSDDRLLVDFKNEWKPWKFLDMGLTASINYSRSTAPNTSWQTLTDMTYYIQPYSVIKDANGRLTNIRTISYASEQAYQALSGMKDTGYNPITDAYDSYSKNQSFTTRLNAYLRFKIWKGLTAEVGGSWQRGTSTYKSIDEADSYKMRLAYNNSTSIENHSSHYVPDGDMINETRNQSENWTVRTQVNYTGQFGKHHVSALAGNEVRRISYDNNTYATRLGYNSTAGSFTPINMNDFKNGKYNSDMIGSNDLASSLTYGSYSLRDNRFVSWYFNGAYEYDNRYLVSGSVREDLTNFFGTNPKYRHKPMWSIGGTWKLSNEKFFKVNWIDRLYLRTSYGVNGNISLSEGPYLILSAGSYNGTTGGVSYGISSFPNNSLRWEKTTTTNLGFDADFINGRVGISFDYYYKKSTDLLANDALDPTTGATRVRKNVGAIENNGIEISLHGKPVVTRDFTWNVGYNLSLNKNKVLKYNVARNYPTSWAWVQTINAEGYPMNGLFGYHFAGLNDKGQALIYNKAGEKTLAQNATVDDIYYQGTATPKADMSLTNTFIYKNWSLSFMFIAKLGHKFRKDTFQGSNYNSRYFSKRWKKPGDEATTVYPAYQSWNMDFFYYPFMDINIGDASYAKLRDLTLSYEFNKALISKIGLSNARVYLQARNLFRITAKGVDIDPEAFENNFSGGMGGMTNAGYSALPLSQEYYIGISFGF